MRAKTVVVFLLAFSIVAAADLVGADQSDWGENMVVNPDFEKGEKGWEGFGPAVKVDTTNARSGKASLMLSPDEEVVSIWQALDVDGGQVSAEIAARSEGLKGAAGMKVRCLDEKGTLLEEVWPCHLPHWKIGWRTFRGTAHLPRGTKRIEVHLTAQGGDVWFDDVSLCLPLAPVAVADAIKENGWVYLSSAVWAEKAGHVIRNAQQPFWRLSEELQVGNKVFSRGLGMIAAAEVSVDLAEKAERFRAVVGVHRLAEGGTAQFCVYGDDEELFDSGELVLGDEPKAVDVSVEDVRRLRLVVKGEEGTEADWCDAMLLGSKVKELPDSSHTIHPQKGGFKVKQVPLPAPLSPLWTLTVADLDGDGLAEHVLGRIDGKIAVFTHKMKKLWYADVGGLPFIVKCGDVTGDGKKEVVVASLNETGDVQLLSCEGKLMWSMSLGDQIFTALALGDIDMDDKEEIVVGYGAKVVALNDEPAPLWQRDFGGPRVSSLAVGNIGGDERPEIIVGFSSQSLRAAALSGEGEPLWGFSSPELRGGLKLISPRIADLNGDRRNEIMFGFDGRSALALTGDGQLLWCRQNLGARYYRRRFSSGSVLIEVANFCPEVPGLETLVMPFDNMYMLDKDGYQIWSGRSGIKIAGCVLSPETYPGLVSIFLPSSGFRDRHFYRITFERGVKNALADATVSDVEGRNLDRIHAALTARKHHPDIPDELKAEKFHIIVFARAEPEFIKEAYGFLKKRESKNLEFIMMMWTKELPTELHRGKLMTQEEIIQLARFCEQNSIPFLLFVDHGCGPYITIATAKKVLDAAPEWSRGFYVAEDSSLYPSEKWGEFMEWVTELMGICRERGKKVIFKEMFDCWAMLPADPNVFRKLFNKRYRDVVVPMFATNNAHAPDLTMAGMVGLRMAERVKSWGMSSQNWNWNWDHKPELDFASICPDDIIFRMDLVAACLGATYFHIEGGQSFLQDASSLTPDAKRHRDLLQELVRRNVLFPVKPERIQSLSELVIVRKYNAAVSWYEGCGTPSRRTDPRLRNGLLGVHYTLQTTADDYFGKYAYQAKRYIDGLFPCTKYGFVPIVPEHAQRLWPLVPPKVYTDGNNVWLGRLGLRKKTAKDAKDGVMSLLQRGANNLQFKADNVFMAAHDVGDTYRVYLVDTGYLDPLGAAIRIEINLPADQFEITDLVSGENIPCEEKVATVKVPAGGFVALSVREIERLKVPFLERFRFLNFLKKLLKK